MTVVIKRQNTDASHERSHFARRLINLPSPLQDVQPMRNRFSSSELRMHKCHSQPVPCCGQIGSTTCFWKSMKNQRKRLEIFPAYLKIMFESPGECPKVALCTQAMAPSIAVHACQCPGPTEVSLAVAKRPPTATKLLCCVPRCTLSAAFDVAVVVTKTKQISHLAHFSSVLHVWLTSAPCSEPQEDSWRAGHASTDSFFSFGDRWDTPLDKPAGRDCFFSVNHSLHVLVQACTGHT